MQLQNWKLSIRLNQVRANGTMHEFHQIKNEKRRESQGTNRSRDRSGTQPLWRLNFRNPKLEGRRIFAESLGTFMLVLAGAGGAVVSSMFKDAVSPTALAFTPGLIVMVVILFMGKVSGAHLNPAVTVSFAARGDFPWRRVPAYVIAQLIGSVAACLFLWALLGKVGMLGATEPGKGISDLQAVFVELVLAFGLVSTILGTASQAQNVGPLSAIGVGAYIAVAGLWAGALTGASMNPARSFGPDVLLPNFAHYWVYVLGPFAGGLIAVGVAYILRGPGGDTAAVQAAQGTLGGTDLMP